MKKYMLLFTATILSVITIGTYYVYGAMDRMPEFTLTTVSGDADLVEDLYLEGIYFGRRQQEDVTITLSGSDYRSKRSIYWREVEWINTWLHRMEDVQQLYSEYRGFMRGKGELDGFYQDENTIVYVEASTLDRREGIRLALEVLDKASNGVETIEIEQTVPSDQTLLFADVMDAQLLNNEVHVLIMKGYHEKPEEFWVYVLDRSNGTLLRGEQLDLGSEVDDDSLIDVVTDSTASAPNSYVLFRERKYGELQSNENRVTRTTSSRIFVYSYLTGTVTPLQQEWVQSEGPDPRFYLEGTRIYRVVDGGYGLPVEVWRHDRETGESGQISVEAENLGQDQIWQYELKDGLLYLLSISYTGDHQSVHVLDASTGESLYEGHVTVNGESQEPLSELRFGGMIFHYD